jgi:ABC-2 type transport system permease protein
MARFLNFFIMQCHLASRSKIALFWSFVYPVAMLLLMLSVFGDMNKAGAVGGDDPRLMTVTGVYVLTIMSGGIFAMATVLSADFQSGVYKRLKLTDLSALQVILALMLRQFVIILLGAVLVMAGAKFLFSVTPNGNLGSVVFLTAVGCVLFSSIGILIANVCSRPPTATAIANAVFLVMLFLSGSAVPKAFFPHWLSNASQVLPASHLFDLLESQLYYGDRLGDSPMSLGILMAMCLCFFGAAIATFKWK